MKIVIAPQTFKGCASAKNVAEALARGIRKVSPSAILDLVPIADGGDGTLDVFLDSKGGVRIQSNVTNALGEKIVAEWGVITGVDLLPVIESASICGLAQIPKNKRNPLLTTTYGVGEAIRHVLDQGYQRLFVGLGGSATNDAGIGMAQALGIRFLDDKGNELPRGGAGLINLKHIDMTQRDARLNKVQIIAGCDVINPMIGPEGASKIYGPQKGASPQMVHQLEEALRNFVDVIKQELGIDISNIDFGGAAGGAGAAMSIFLNAELVSGAAWILNAIDFAHHLNGADLLIVGEGRLDGQTANLKAPLAAAQIAKERNLPVIAIAGSLGADSERLHEKGISAFIPVSFIPLDAPPDHALNYLSQAAEEAMRCFLAG